MRTLFSLSIAALLFAVSAVSHAGTQQASMGVSFEVLASEMTIQNAPSIVLAVDANLPGYAERWVAVYNNQDDANAMFAWQAAQVMNCVNENGGMDNGMPSSCLSLRQNFVQSNRYLG